MTLVFFLGGRGVGVVAAAAAAAAGAAVVPAPAAAVVEVDNDDSPSTGRQCAVLGKRSQARSSGRARREREPIYDVHCAIMKS